MLYVVGNLVALAVLVALGIVLLRWILTGEAPDRLQPALDRARRLLGRARPVPEPLPPVLPALELRRLAAHVRYVEESDYPRKVERLAAARLAYDYVLRDYCRAVDIPVPTAIRGLSREQRFDMESALIGGGHEW